MKREGAQAIRHDIVPPFIFVLTLIEPLAPLSAELIDAAMRFIGDICISIQKQGRTPAPGMCMCRGHATKAVFAVGVSASNEDSKEKKVYLYNVIFVLEMQG